MIRMICFNTRHITLLNGYITFWNWRVTFGNWHITFLKFAGPITESYPLPNLCLPPIKVKVREKKSNDMPPMVFYYPSWSERDMAKNRMIPLPMSTYTPKVLNDTPPEATCPLTLLQFPRTEGSVCTSFTIVRIPIYLLKGIKSVFSLKYSLPESYYSTRWHYYFRDPGVSNRYGEGINSKKMGTILDFEGYPK